MRDMFFNYDNNIDKKEYPIERRECDNTRILESSPTLSLVLDIKGNEIGVCAKHNTPFELFFMLDGCVENSSIEKLVLNSSISLQLVDYWHKVVLSKDISPANCYIGDDTLKISFSQDDVDRLKKETYYIQLSLNWPGGSYILYSEDNGFLTIK